MTRIATLLEAQDADQVLPRAMTVMHGGHPRENRQAREELVGLHDQLGRLTDVAMPGITVSKR